MERERISQSTARKVEIFSHEKCEIIPSSVFASADWRGVQISQGTVEDSVNSN
jgi:hypothetical protein